MSAWGNVTRPFWLPGLNEVSGAKQKGLGGWICDEDYQIYKSLTPTSFVLNFSDHEPLLGAFAADINRIAVASFETINGITKSAKFPKSTAWLVIQTYYAAFFAAHALMRMFGSSCAPIEREQIKSITRIADLYGNLPSKPMTGGLYHLQCDTNASELNGQSVAGSPHEEFWRVFHERTVRLSSEVLTGTTDTLANRQLASTKLSELADNLCFASAARGRWLSTMRNAVNYSQKHATWYPYADQKKYYAQLFDKASEWKVDPLDLDLTSHDGKELRRFQSTCSFLISALRESILEMARRCSAGKSFHAYGSLAFLNLLEQRATAKSAATG